MTILEKKCTKYIKITTLTRWNIMYYILESALFLDVFHFQTGECEFPFRCSMETDTSRNYFPNNCMVCSFVSGWILCFCNTHPHITKNKAINETVLKKDKKKRLRAIKWCISHNLVFILFLCWGFTKNNNVWSFRYFKQVRKESH